MFKKWLRRLIKGPEIQLPYTDNQPATDEARAELDADRIGLMPPEPDPVMAIRSAAQWICRAQENSVSNDGGIARHYSLNTGWGASYPETTGYLIPTLIDCAKFFDDSALTGRVDSMLRFLLNLQFADGAFPGGMAGEEPNVPVVFNTGQILIGLAAAVSGINQLEEYYLVSMRSAAEWLVECQDRDGAWRKHQSPFAGPGDRAYETHVALGLLRAAAVEKSDHYAAAALKNIEFCLTFQRPNGFVTNCCLTDKAAPLTHTLGYFLRGVVEGYLYSKEPALLQAALKTAYGLGAAVDENGFLAGRLDSDFKAVVPYACLTGSVQIAESFLLLHQATGDEKLFVWGQRLNRYVRRTIRVDGADGIRGGVKGVFPVNGRYNSYQYLNWAAKFFIDSQLLELAIVRERKGNAKPQNADLGR